MGLTRLEHWATRSYHDFLLTNAKALFAWGSNDCALFAANGIKAITGIDIAVDFRNKYTTEAGALAIIHSVTGGNTVADAAAYCAQKFGLVELPHPLMAQRGDLVIAANGGNTLAGLVHLNGRHVVTVGEHGITRLSIRSVTRAWHY